MTSKAPLALGLLFILTLAAYSNSFKAEFVFDDGHQIVENHNIRDLGNIPLFFVKPGLASDYTELKGYRPVTYSTFAINYAISGYSVYSYHLFNFLLHFINALLVWLVTTRVIAQPGGNADHASLAPYIAAALFALHPIQTNAVTYISGRAALLATFFSLLSLLCFIALRQGGDKKKATLLSVLAAVFFFIGLLAKEMTVATLGIMAAYDIVFTVPRGGIAKARSALLTYLPLAILLGVYLIAKSRLQGFIAVGVQTHTPLEYLMSEMKVFWLYARLLLLPFNQNVDYNLPATTSLDLQAMLCAAGIALVAVLIFKLRRKNLAACFFGLWSLAALLPESSIIPITDVAVEYRLYLPSIGFIAMLAILAEGSPIARRKAFRVAASAVAALLLILTFNRNAVWATEYTLWNDAANKAPYSSRPHNNLGVYLAGQGRTDEAVREFREALSLAPGDSDAHNNLGLFYLDHGQADKAVEEFQAAIKLDPTQFGAHANLGLAYLKSGEFDKAAEYLEAAIRLNPANPNTHNNLGIAYFKNGLPDKAVEEFRAVLSLDKTNEDARRNIEMASSAAPAQDADGADAHYLRGMELQSTGQHAEAIKEFEAAARIKPDALDIHNSLAISYAQAGMLEDSVREFRLALRLQPGNKSLKENLAGAERMLAESKKKR